MLVNSELSEINKSQDDLPEEKTAVSPDDIPEEKTAVHPTVPDMKRRPYHERYYMLYGNEGKPPETIDTRATLEFLTELGYGNNFLRQAREGRELAARIESANSREKEGRHYCDFCGVPLLGIEYDILRDGRERCPNCSRTAIKTESEIKAIYDEVNRNMELLFNIRIKANIRVQMVNAKKLHASLGKSFIPSKNPDPRVIGVAIKNQQRITGKTDYCLLIENGSPRMSTIKTMVHELTHVWQYTNWDPKEIYTQYGPDQNLEIYEGMAKWAEVQYCYLLGENGTAKREEFSLLNRNDEYGKGFVKYCSVYPLSDDSGKEVFSPFDNIHKPL